MEKAYPAMRRKGQIEAMAFSERERLHDRGMDRESMNGLMARLQDRLGSKNKLAEAIYGRKNAATSVKQLVDGSTRYTEALIDQILRIAKNHDVRRHETSAQDDTPAAKVDVGSTEPAAAPEDTTTAVATTAVADAAPSVESDRPDADPDPELATDGEEEKAMEPQAHPSAGDEVVDAKLATVQEGAQEGSMTEGDTMDDHQNDDVGTSTTQDADRQETAVEHDRGGDDVVSQASKDAAADQPGNDGPVQAADWLAGVRGRRGEYGAEIEACTTEVARLDAEIERLAARRSQETARIDALNAGILGIDEALAILQRT